MDQTFLDRSVVAPLRSDAVEVNSGGLGRTGLIAARLLVEFGMEPGEAIRRVCTARPGAIQNREQEEYVLQCNHL